MFFDFQFRSLCGIARIPYAAGGLEQQVVELPPQNYSVAKILKKARLQGPVSGCQNQPKTGYVRRYLQSILFAWRQAMRARDHADPARVLRILRTLQSWTDCVLSLLGPRGDMPVYACPHESLQVHLEGGFLQ